MISQWIQYLILESKECTTNLTINESKKLMADIYLTYNFFPINFFILCFSGNA